MPRYRRGHLHEAPVKEETKEHGCRKGSNPSCHILHDNYCTLLASVTFAELRMLVIAAMAWSSCCILVDDSILPLRALSDRNGFGGFGSRASPSSFSSAPCAAISCFCFSCSSACDLSASKSMEMGLGNSSFSSLKLSHAHCTTRSMFSGSIIGSNTSSSAMTALSFTSSTLIFSESGSVSSDGHRAVKEFCHCVNAALKLTPS